MSARSERLRLQSLPTKSPRRSLASKQVRAPSARAYDLRKELSELDDELGQLAKAEGEAAVKLSATREAHRLAEQAAASARAEDSSRALEAAILKCVPLVDALMANGGHLRKR